MTNKQNYHKLKTIPIEDVLPHVADLTCKKKHMFEGILVGVGSLRLRTFKNKGTACAYCGVEATHFEINDFIDKKGRRLHSEHLNLFSGDMLMTKDHIQPKSSGGLNQLHNMVTSCQECNALKGTLELPSIIAKHNENNNE